MTHLPIYKAAFDLNVYVEQIVRHFSRYHKYTLGTELRERARSLVATDCAGQQSARPGTTHHLIRTAARVGTVKINGPTVQGS